MERKTTPLALNVVFDFQSIRKSLFGLKGYEHSPINETTQKHIFN